MKILMIRHGESAGNVYARDAKKKYDKWLAKHPDPTRCGPTPEHLLRLPTAIRHQDLPLSDLGIEQATTLAEDDEFDHFFSQASFNNELTYGAVFSSPYKRARQTAELAGVWDYRLDERLRDREQGVMDGLTSEGVKHFYPAVWADRTRNGKFYHRPAGGESWADVVLRMRSFLFEQKMLGTQHLLLFSHDVTILAAIYICDRLTEDQILDFQANTPVANASLTYLDY